MPKISDFNPSRQKIRMLDENKIHRERSEAAHEPQSDLCVHREVLKIRAAPLGLIYNMCGAAVPHPEREHRAVLQVLRAKSQRNEGGESCPLGAQMYPFLSSQGSLQGKAGVRRGCHCPPTSAASAQGLAGGSVSQVPAQRKEWQAKPGSPTGAHSHLLPRFRPIFWACSGWLCYAVSSLPASPQSHLRSPVF